MSGVDLPARSARVEGGTPAFSDRDLDRFRPDTDSLTDEEIRAVLERHGQLRWLDAPEHERRIFAADVLTAEAERGARQTGGER